MYETRRYLIIPTSIVDNIDFTQVHQTSVDTLRRSVDGTLTFVKYDVEVIEEDISITFINAATGIEETTVILAGVYGRPSIYSPEYTEYTHDDILRVLASPEWSISFPEN
jgi:hypothetical protein